MSAHTDLLAEARALRPLIEAESDATDESLTMTPPVVEAFEKTGLFHLMVPRELGGAEADCSTVIDVIEELCHQDGSIGWTQMANASATSYCAFLDPEVAREMHKRHIRHLPIVEDGHLTGMLSLRDLLREHLNEKRHEVQAMKAYIQGEGPSQ